MATPAPFLMAKLLYKMQSQHANQYALRFHKMLCKKEKRHSFWGLCRFANDHGDEANAVWQRATGNNRNANTFWGMAPSFYSEYPV